MEKYEVRIVAAAEQDLNQIFGYIADVLHEPEAAARLLLSFREAIDSLKLHIDFYDLISLSRLKMR